jgi:uncharacterized protein YjdB
MVAGVAPGTATITAAVDGKSATATITVLDGGVVSSTGGTLNVESGAVQIVFPADALASNTNVSVAVSNAFAADPRVIKGTPFDFGPTGTNFAKPIVLKIKYDPANLLSGTEEAALELYLHTSSGWQVVPGSTADTTANIVSATVSHFSTYAILTPEAVAGVAISGPRERPIVNGASSLVVGESEQLTATLTAADGRVLSNRVATWSSSDATIASISPTGVLAALKPGTATIIASAGGKTSSVVITVTLVRVATVTVSSPTTPMVVGATQQLTATAKDAAGNVLADRTVSSWVSSVPSVATVSASGLVRAVAAGGPVTITATSEGVSGTSTALTVTLVPVATVTVSAPTTPMVVGGATQQLAAILRDASNNTLTDRTVSWVSSNTAVLTVSPSGYTVTVTAVGPGTATITATSESVASSPTPTITVNPMLASGPLRASTVNPRYFADPSGRVVYLTGSEYWNTIEDNGPSNPPPVFDYSAFLDFLQNHNHNFTRLFMWEQARWSSLSTIDHWFSPNLYVRTGPGIGIDSAPKFDVTQINPAYLARVRQRVIDAGARGIYVSVMLFNGWAVEFKAGTGKNPWLSHPFNAANNINNINGDPNNDQSGQEIQTLSIPAVTALQDTYVKAVIDAVNDLDNVIYEISNETNSNPAADAWQYHMIDLIRSYEAGKPKQHPIGMSVPWPGGSNSEVLNSTADWVAMNGDLNNPPSADGSKVSLWDTDHLCGICGDAAWPWRSLTRGHNTLLMDGYNGAPGYTDPAYNPADPKWEVIRKNMGYARSYALRMDLANARPRSDLASSSFCLAVVGSEYLVFNAESGSVSVNLAGVSGSRTVEWLNPATGETIAGGTVTGGGSVSFTPPFSGMAVLYIHR